MRLSCVKQWNPYKTPRSWNTIRLLRMQKESWVAPKSSSQHKMSNPSREVVHLPFLFCFRFQVFLQIPRSFTGKRRKDMDQLVPPVLPRSTATNFCRNKAARMLLTLASVKSMWNFWNIYVYIDFHIYQRLFCNFCVHFWALEYMFLLLWSMEYLFYRWLLVLTGLCQGTKVAIAPSAVAHVRAVCQPASKKTGNDSADREQKPAAYWVWAPHGKLSRRRNRLFCEAWAGNVNQDHWWESSISGDQSWTGWKLVYPVVFYTVNELKIHVQHCWARMRRYQTGFDGRIGFGMNPKPLLQRWVAVFLCTLKTFDCLQRSLGKPKKISSNEPRGNTKSKTRAKLVLFFLKPLKKEKWRIWLWQIYTESDNSVSVRGIYIIIYIWFKLGPGPLSMKWPSLQHMPL